MKKLTRIRIKYILIIISLIIALGTVLPTFMRYYVSVTAHVVGIPNGTETYIIKFHNNGGTGEMQNMTIHYNETKKLTKNTFNYESYNFAGWNTEPDGSGTNYDDEQEINNESYIDGNEINLYARWTQKVAEINGKYYDTLNAAIKAVPEDGNEITVKLLNNVSESIKIAAGKNIRLNLQDFKISNDGNTNVIINSGTLKIINGTIETNASTNGAVNNEKDGFISISGGRIISTGGRQALYNNNGTAEISGNAYLSASTKERPAVTNNTATSKMTITGGTIISTGQSGIENKGILVLGIEDEVYNSDAFVIKGKEYGINSTTSFSFFDGAIKGKNLPLNDVNKATEREIGSYVVYFELENDEDYITAGLETEIETVTFDANNGESSETSRKVTKGKIVGNLPTASRQGYTFDGWFTELEGGEEVTKNYIVDENITFYAHWTSKDAVEYNGTRYVTVKDAMKDIPNNTKSTITLIADIEESITVSSEKDIVFDLNGHKLKNYGNANAVIKNEGNLEIINGNIESDALNGVIDNEPTGTIKISGVNVRTETGRQTIYNNGGYIEITGHSYFQAAPSGKPTSQPLNRATIQNINNGTIIITGGTVIATKQQAISNSGTLTLGVKDGSSEDAPTIIGEEYGIVSTGTLNYYDGIIKGINSAISGEITDEDENLQIIDGTETINEKEYKTLCLETKDAGE